MPLICAINGMYYKRKYLLGQRDVIFRIHAARVIKINLDIYLIDPDPGFFVSGGLD